jgi:hypothetical protein
MLYMTANRITNANELSLTLTENSVQYREIRGQ